MRKRLALLVLAPLVLTLGGPSTASAAPTSGAPATAHGPCVAESAKPDGAGGRSTAARDKGTCTPPLRCTENEDEPGTVTRNSRSNTVTVAGSGEGSAGSSLSCATKIRVTKLDTVSFTYQLGEGTDPCGGGVPRVYVVIGGTYYNTIDGDPQCSEAKGNTVTYKLPVSGTVTEVGFVYDRGDEGSVTYSKATIDGITLNI